MNVSVHLGLETTTVDHHPQTQDAPIGCCSAEPACSRSNKPQTSRSSPESRLQQLLQHQHCSKLSGTCKCNAADKGAQGAKWSSYPGCKGMGLLLLLCECPSCITVTGQPTGQHKASAPVNSFLGANDHHGYTGCKQAYLTNTDLHCIAAFHTQPKW